MKYILDNNVIFSPEAQTLTSCTEPERVVKLTYPASCCLSILLRYAPEVMTRQYLMDEIRACCADAIPTDNAFYQCVSMIRRGLIQAGMEYDVVRTIPRVGVCIADGVRILRQEEEVDSRGLLPSSTQIARVHIPDDLLQEGDNTLLSARFLGYAGVMLLLIALAEVAILMN